MAVQAEVPVLVCHLEIHAVEELRRGALSCHISVTFSDLSVSVKVHEFVLYRLPCRIVLLLICIVCIWGIAHHLAAQVASGAL